MITGKDVLKVINSVKPEKHLQVRDFTNFKKGLEDIASISLNNYNKYGRKTYGTKERRTSEEIDQILMRDNEQELRQLSRDYWNLSGLYRRLIMYMSNMLTYDILVVPKISASKKPEKNKLINGLTDASYFIDSLNIEKEFSRIMSTMLVDGVYYGFFKECPNNKYIFQDLDPNYCRTRYKSANDMPVLEFDLTYFVQIKGREAVTNVDELNLYPKYVVKNYKKYFDRATTIDRKTGKTYLKDKNSLEEGRWLIIPDSLGIVFYYKDTKPFFTTVIESIEDLNEYKGIEKSLDKQELKKILLQTIPMNDQGELLFSLEEANEIHKAAVKMLRNNPDVDVFTTMAETEMLDVQDSAQANRDNLEKMERSFYNEAGVSKNLFASDGTTALDYSQKVDMALALDMSKPFATFLTYHANRKFPNKKFFLEVSIMPITHYNREEMFDLYLRGAQYGYSKIMAGVASGIKQSNLLSLITLENEYLNLAETMIPLQSSHTTSGKDVQEEAKGDKNKDSNVTDDKGGAPKKDGMEKSDKTRQNEESK